MDPENLPAWTLKTCLFSPSQTFFLHASKGGKMNVWINSIEGFVQITMKIVAGVRITKSSQVTNESQEN